MARQLTLAYLALLDKPPTKPFLSRHATFLPKERWVTRQRLRGRLLVGTIVKSKTLRHTMISLSATSYYPQQQLLSENKVA